MEKEEQEEKKDTSKIIKWKIKNRLKTGRKVGSNGRKQKTPKGNVREERRGDKLGCRKEDGSNTFAVGRDEWKK